MGWEEEEPHDDVTMEKCDEIWFILSWVHQEINGYLVEYQK